MEHVRALVYAIIGAVWLLGGLMHVHNPELLALHNIVGVLWFIAADVAVLCVARREERER